MPTKLSRYAEGIIEAAWLVAIIVVPVFFNVYSSRIFEPDKLSLLRSLALLILAAWVVKLVDEGRPRWERIQPGTSWWKTILGIPMILPVLALAIVYLIATIFSVAPGTAFWGSYQRLQGTYSTFSYLVVFFAILGNLRRRDQLERLITVLVLSSLPIVLYGILQHYRKDPIPWGGDVASRIAANLGNSIFVAAYLIMVFPLTVMRVIVAFRAILQNAGNTATNVARATAYVFILVLQLIGLYFSGSRGPWLGWLAGVFFMMIIISLYYRQRKLTLGIIGLASLGLIFLVLLNIPKGPLESLRDVPALSRVSQVFASESRTGRVRTLIWQGAAQLVLPHAPLKYPDGSVDKFNFLRPLIGYGPESMYVAYNPFYQPELTQVEKRNASPDRSHNETWDSLVTTGFIGLVVYLFVFVSVFYYAVKAMGFIPDTRHRNLFLIISLASALLGAAGAIILLGANYFGVGLPGGIVAGVFIYLLFAAITGEYHAPQTEGEKLRMLLMVALFAAIVAHFIEINFGIAIAVTRLYFWTYTGLIVTAGFILPLYDVYSQQPAAQVVEPSRTGSATAMKKTGSTSQAAARRKRQAQARSNNWLRPALLSAGLVSIILVTLGYNYIGNSQGLKSAFDVLITSFTRLPSGASAPGILLLIFITWLVGAVVFASEDAPSSDPATWMRMFGAILGVSLAVALFYWMWHSAGLAALANATAANVEEILGQVARYEGILTRYYFMVLLIILGLAVYIPAEWPAKAVTATAFGGVSAAVLLVAVLLLSSYTNMRVVQADIAFKLADPFTKPDSWPVAIRIYQRADELAPTEDYYYLFLGRAYLEEAKSLSDAAQRDSLVSQGEADLRKAQALNPLNTDHTANLARLYSLWASFTSDATQKLQRAQKSSDYFSRAVTLSPQNARLWDEWALVYLNLLNQPEKANELLQHSLQIDPYYDWTYGLMGDYTTRKSREATDPAVQNQLMLQATDFYSKALSLVDPADATMKYSYAIARGALDSQLKRIPEAIKDYTIALPLASTDQWRVEETLANLYVQAGDRASAMKHLQTAISSAPDDQKNRLNGLLAQITTQAQP